MTARVMGAQQAIADDYEVLLIDDVCSFLTPRLVQRLRDSGREIVGVYSPGDGPDAKRRLLECGITDVVEADAAPEEFLATAGATLVHSQIPAAVLLHRSDGYRIGVMGSGPGTGVTEVAVTLGDHLARLRGAVLVDLNQAWPAVAQRLDLPVHPNLRTAVDLVLHSPDRTHEAIHLCGEMGVVGGLPNPGAGQPLPAHELAGLVDDLGTDHRYLVIDLGPMGDPQLLNLLRLDMTLLVGSATPVGLTRLIQCAESLPSARGRELAILVNRVPRSGHRRDEVRAELGRALPDVPLVLLPDDSRIERASWDGVVANTGPLYRAVRQVAQLVNGANQP